jgi:hypothetical protein
MPIMQKKLISGATPKKGARVPDKSALGQLLIEVKIADAAVRRDKHVMEADNIRYEQMADAISKLYAFLRSKPISEIERLCK